MDLPHRFNIGDVVRIKGSAPNCRLRFLVAEQHFQRCYGGTQLKYECIPITADGPPTGPATIIYAESVLELSEPFQERREVSEWRDMVRNVKAEVKEAQ